MPCKICGCPEARWLRVSTVAEQFRCSAKKICRMLKQGDIEGVQFGREWRVDHASLDAYVRKDSTQCPLLPDQ
jgi:excisionase family DNA binding protein